MELLEAPGGTSFRLALWSAETVAAHTGRGAVEPAGTIRQGLAPCGVHAGDARCKDKSPLGGGRALFLAASYGLRGVAVDRPDHPERLDAQATSTRFELQIGRDCRFIRINGTVVGGWRLAIFIRFSYFFCSSNFAGGWRTYT